MSEVLCFAYGSNMLLERLTVAERAPSARLVHVAELRDHTLTFAKIGADGSGKCTIAASATEHAGVHGVVYSLARADLPALDRAEGGYDRVPVQVWMGGRAANVETYRARTDKLDPSLLPFDWYHALVVAGATRASLPAEYLAQVAAHPTTRDHDEVRRARHFALIG